MRRVAIVGGGQAGLPLALALQSEGYLVTLMTNRSAQDVRNGRVMSSQCMFNSALQIERQLGLNSFESSCPPIDGIGVTVPDPQAPGQRLIDWASRLQAPALAIDQRLKFAEWTSWFANLGGNLVIKDAGLLDLEHLAASNDLVIVAAGKGEIVSLFERDSARSAFNQPMRALALTYVHGLQATDDYSRIAFNLIPGVGEYFVFPALTTSGSCHIMVFEGIIGGAMDCWRSVRTPAEHLAQSLDVLQQFLPWEAARARNVELTDANGFLSGSFAPTIRKPILTLPSGRHVLGLGDAVVVNDPITGQGSNSAMKASKVYLDSIVQQGDRPFTAEWMQRTFDEAWRYAESVVKWTNSLLLPPPQHILQALGAAGASPSLAAAIANGFDDPRTFFPWWSAPEECARFVGAHMQAMSADTAPQ